MANPTLRSPRRKVPPKGQGAASWLEILPGGQYRKGIYSAIAAFAPLISGYFGIPIDDQILHLISAGAAAGVAYIVPNSSGS